MSGVDYLALDYTTDSSGGGGGGAAGLVDWQAASVTGGNGSAPNGSFGAVTNLAQLVLDAAEGDIIGIDVSATLFGPQTFMRVVVIGGTSVIGSAGWYRSTDITNQGTPVSGTRRFQVAAADVVAAQVTLELQAQGSGNNPLVLEGSEFEATNFGPIVGLP